MARRVKLKAGSVDSAKLPTGTDAPAPNPAVAEPVFEKGTADRTYLSTQVPESVTAARAASAQDWPYVAVLLVVGLYVRCRSLSYPNSVVFDEVHFGNYARKYILGKFFMDVHPPLTKMLFAAVAKLGNFKGDFEFKTIGDVYPPTVPYVLMRAFPAVLGLLTVVLAYLTLAASGVRRSVAFATAACLLFENSFVTISRYILLDSPLVFFIAAAVYSFKKFEAQQPFSMAWYRALVATGVALGLAFASKWVGLFTVAWVGAICVVQMWLLIGDLKVSSKSVWRHAIARVSFFLGVPVLIYLFAFAVHFLVLQNDGDGAPFMSSAFRANLHGSLLPQNTTGPVGFGSKITIRHVGTQGGYLHSHKLHYPAGSKQQQITLYPHIDENNEWIIEPYNRSIPEGFQALHNGDKIRLRHLNTHCRLHTHDEKPPMTDRDWQKEASCYGYEGFGGDPNDDWIVEVVKRETPVFARDEVKAIHTVFRLRHALSGNYLFSSEVKLPDWGSNQQEVTGASLGRRALTYWFIETNEHQYVNPELLTSYPKLGFFKKFIESHKVMWHINGELKGYHNWQSNPQDWPWLIRGINYWSRDKAQVYFLGNPVVWWSATASVIGFIIYVATTFVRWLANKELNTSSNVMHFNYQALTYFAGWGLHYLPFFIMGRQLFLHHYLPAQYFAILGFGHLLELAVACSGRFAKPAYAAVAMFTVATTIVFYTYSALIYGEPWTRRACFSSKYVSSWDYNCNAFLARYQDYSNVHPPLYTPTSSTASLEAPESRATAKPLPRVEKKPEPVQPKSELFEAPPPPETYLNINKSSDSAKPADSKSSSEEAPVGEPQDKATPQKKELSANVKETVGEPSVEDKEAPSQPKLEIQEIKDVKETQGNAGAAGKPVVEQAAQRVDDAAKAVKDAAEPVVEQVAEQAGKAAEAVQKAAEPVVEKAQANVGQAAEAVQKAAEPVVQKAQENAGQAAEAVQKAAEPVVQKAQENVEQASKAAQEAVKPAEEKKVENAAKSVSEAVKPAAEAASKKVEEAVGAAESVVKKGAEAAQKAAQPVVDKAAEGAKKAEEVAESAKAKL